MAALLLYHHWQEHPCVTWGQTGPGRWHWRTLGRWHLPQAGVALEKSSAGDTCPRQGWPWTTLAPPAFCCDFVELGSSSATSSDLLGTQVTQGQPHLAAPAGWNHSWTFPAAAGGAITVWAAARAGSSPRIRNSRVPRVFTHLLWDPTFETLQCLSQSGSWGCSTCRYRCVPGLWRFPSAFGCWVQCKSWCGSAVLVACPSLVLCFSRLVASSLWKIDQYQP